MSSIGEALKALVSIASLDQKTRDSKAAENWIETAERILRKCPGKGKSREQPLICLEISGLLTGDKFVTREQYIAVSGTTARQYLQLLQAAWNLISSLQDASLPKLTVQLAAKAMGAEELIPWAEILISGYEKTKNISRDEQPACIIAAFELVKPSAKDTFPVSIQLIRQIKQSMAVEAKEIKKDPKYADALSKGASARKNSRLSASFSAETFSIEIEASRSSSPLSEAEKKPESKRTYLLPTVPYYETRQFEMLMGRIKSLAA